MARKDSIVKTHFNLSLAIVASVALLGASFAQTLKAGPIKAPAHLGMKVLKYQVGTNGIALPVDNYSVVRSQASYGPNMLMDTTSLALDAGGGSYYNPTGDTKETIDFLPLGGASVINGGAFTYYKPDTGTFDADVTIYDMSASNANEIYEVACATPAGGSVTATFVGLVGDPSFAFIVPYLYTVPICAPGDVGMGVRFYNDSTAGAASPGMFLADGGTQGAQLGVPINDKDVYTAKFIPGMQSSAGDSSNFWQEYDNVALTYTCYWYGGNPIGNFAFQIYGNYGVQCYLDTGSGPAFAAPDNYVHVKVVDPAGVAASYDTAVRVTVDTDDVTGGALGLAVSTFTLPFDPSLVGATRDVYVRSFKGFLNAAAYGCVVPDTSILCEVNAYDIFLIAGQVTEAGDPAGGQVNLFDLNTVLGNFGSNGEVIP